MNGLDVFCVSFNNLGALCKISYHLKILLGSSKSHFQIRKQAQRSWTIYLKVWILMGGLEFHAFKTPEPSPFITLLPKCNQCFKIFPI